MMIVRLPLTAARRRGYVIDHIEALKAGGMDNTSQADKDAEAEGTRTPRYAARLEARCR
jgi:hypothetical protein